MMTMIDPIDFDPPEQPGERMVWDFAELARTIEAAMSDPVLRKQIEANRDRLLAACETALAIETALDAPALSAAE